MIHIVVEADFHAKPYSMDSLKEWYHHFCNDIEREKTRNGWPTIESAIYNCKKLLRDLDDEIEFEESIEGMSEEEVCALLTKQIRQVKMEAGNIEDGEDQPAQAERAESVSATWENETVRVARSTRDSVFAGLVGSELIEYKSVRVAFAEIGLPDSKHVRFRGQLKKSRSEVFEWEGKRFQFEIRAK